MVNNRTNVGKWVGAPPPPKSADQKIRCGPLYDLADLQPLLQNGDVIFWTRDCVRDAQNLGLDAEDAGALILEAVTNGRYHCSEWCEQKSDGPVAACDAYVLTRMEWNEAAHRELRCEYFIKFAIGRTGRIVLTISCHV